MKRFVYIPVSMLEDKDAEQKAAHLSAESRLSIRAGSLDDEIQESEVCIISIPEKSIHSCDEFVKTGFVHSFDITDDFIKFNKNTLLVAEYSNNSKQSFEPIICEKHVIRFRTRHYIKGNAIFNIQNGEQIFISAKVKIL